MYEIIDPIEPLVEKADQFVLENDRYLFDGFFAELEKFCMDNDAIIGGKNGITILLEKEKNKDTYLGYEIYINDTFNKARALADRLVDVKSPFINKETIAVETNIKHKMITIWIHARRLIRLYNLGAYKGIDLFKLINPIKKEALMTEGRVYCMSPEIQLIGVYRRLYNPYPAEGDFSPYDELLSLEDNLFGLIEKSLEKRAKKVVAGKEAPRQPNEVAMALKEKFLQALATDNNLRDCIVIGDYAIFLTDESLSSRESNHLQVITSIEPEVILRYFRKLAEDMGAPGEITSIDYDLKLPDDPQLLKHSLYYKDNSRVSLVDIFNSTTYELVPFKVAEYSGFGPIKIAGLFVLIRFRFIDLYVLQLILNLDKSSSKEGFFKKISDVVSQTKLLRKQTRELIRVKPFEVFQLKNYLGVYISENVARKKIIGQQPGKPMFTKYFPIIKKESTTGGAEDSQKEDLRELSSEGVPVRY